MDIYEPSRELLEFGLRNHFIVNERARASVPVQFATDKEFVAIVSKSGLDDTECFSFGDGLGVLIYALKKYADKNNAFTGTRFARQYRESFVQTNVQAADKCIVLYVQSGKHRISCSL